VVELLSAQFASRALLVGHVPPGETRAEMRLFLQFEPPDAMIASLLVHWLFGGYNEFGIGSAGNGTTAEFLG
jgi:hypothetical protein